MPYKFETDHIKLPEGKDRRVKLTKADKEEIRHLYLEIGGVSLRGLAREYDVDKGTIIYAIYPERREHNYKLRVARGGSKQYYDKSKNTETAREHRRYKAKVLKGEL